MYLAFVSTLVHVMSIIPATIQPVVLESGLTSPDGTLRAAVLAGLLIGPLGAPLFGIVTAIVLIMFFASAFTSPARSRGRSPRLGLVVGFLALAIATLVINVALR